MYLHRNILIHFSKKILPHARNCMISKIKLCGRIGSEKHIKPLSIVSLPIRNYKTTDIFQRAWQFQNTSNSTTPSNNMTKHIKFNQYFIQQYPQTASFFKNSQKQILIQTFSPLSNFLSFILHMLQQGNMAFGKALQICNAFLWYNKKMIPCLQDYHIMSQATELSLIN